MPLSENDDQVEIKESLAKEVDSFWSDPRSKTDRRKKTSSRLCKLLFFGITGQNK